jgi:putative ABC transport system permease protein
MWMRELRYAVRMFAGTPGFTLVALVTLALGIGANTAIFSVIDSVLLRRAPLPGVDRLAVVWETDRNTGTFREPASLPDFLDYRQRSRRIEELAAFIANEVNYTPEQGEPARLQALAITAEFLPALGIQPAIGRGFTAVEAQPGGPAVAVLSDALWARLFDRDRSILGRTIRIDDQQVTVIGVLPRGADFGVFQILRAADYSRSFADRGARAGVDIWLPLQANAASLPRSTHPIFMVARLNDSVASLQQEMAGIAVDLERAYPENAARGIFVEPLSRIVFGPVRPALLVLLAAVGLVLLVACANVANLLLARGTSRRREVAVRTALGADGRTLARQFAAEGLLLALAAAALGVTVAYGGVRLLVALAPADIPRIADAGVDLRVLTVTLIVSILAGLAFGMIPTLQARRVDVQASLKGEGRNAAGGRERTRLRSVLVVAEFALAVMLAIAAALLTRSFWRLNQVDAGFQTAGVLKAEYQLPPSRYPVNFSRFPDFKEMHAFTHRLIDRVKPLPGVQSVAVAGNHPLDPGFTNSFVVVGREAEARNWPEISIRRVTPDYFRTMAVPLVKGRLIGEADGTFAPPVLLVNEAAAQRFFGERDPLGKQIRFWGASRTIVGIVGNERFHGLAEAPPPAVYAPLDQTPSANGAGALLVRTAGNPAALTSAVRGAIHAEDPGLAVFGLEPLAETASRTIAEKRFTMLVLGLLASVALLLAGAGIHGVLSYTVSQRTREIGIRVALGAQPGRVVAMVVGEGLRLAALGTLLGVAGAWVLTRLISGLLYGVTATDPITFAAVPLLLAVVAVIASLVPARRATRVDPVMALRAE